jgi:signal transduction histidine kinase
VRGPWPTVSPAGLWALSAAGALATAAAVALTLDAAPPHHEATAAVLHGVVVAVPVALGCAALARRPDDRFALLLVVAGLLWSTTALVESGDAVLYSLGRLFAWCSEPMVLLLLLAFPSGRLRTANERQLMRAAVAIIAVGYLSSALFASHYPVPSPYGSCGESCPANAFNIVSADGIEAIFKPLREVLSVLLYGLVVAVIARRRRTSGRLLSLALVPVLAVAVFRTVALIVYFVARRADVSGEAIDAIGWVFVATLPFIAISFAAGIAVRRFEVAGALRRVGTRLSSNPTTSDLTEALGEALEDPTVRLVYHVPGSDGHWADATGWPIAAPVAGDDVGVVELRAQNHVLGILVYDAGAGPDRALLDALASFAVVVLENLLLVDRLRSSLDDLSASRGRIVAVADASRRAIERDLHDGAQQRLVGLRLRLSVQSERLADTAPLEAAELRRLGVDVEEAIDNIRELAHGIYPSLLAEQGLAHALQSAARRSPVWTHVQADGIGRFGREIENTVYFSCLEAMQNAVKHAEGATEIGVVLSMGDGLAFEVSDDGRGFDQGAVPAGSGLLNVRDRVMALGGSLQVRSTPQVGTVVAGVLPVARQTPAENV